jgi:hypothetical protein
VNRGWIVGGLAALVVLGGLVIALWPSDSGDAPRPARQAVSPASLSEAESLIRELEPLASDVRCRPSAGDWKCAWKTPTKSCSATVVYGREGVYAGCSRLISETDSLP